MVVRHLDAAFSALSNPTRRSIVDRLARGEAAINELAKPFAMSQQAISKHLAYLEKARLIKKRREGREQYCSLKAEAIREVAAWTENYRRLWEERFTRIDALLDEMRAKQKRGENSE